MSHPITIRILAKDNNARGDLFARLPVSDDSDERTRAALEKYFAYINLECGHIFLDGLPADAEVGSLRLRLENLFVPLHLYVSSVVETGKYGNRPRELHPRQLTLAFKASEEVSGLRNLDSLGGLSRKRVSLSSTLATHRRIAVLASPGAGKSTLLKRLAVAYGDPSRRALTDDTLPNRNWIPLFFRCRELRERARLPFTELLDSLASRAFLGDLATAFRTRIDRALRAGEVLLLVDGLDEITNASDRASFVRSLRTLLSVYPEISFVVTSREAGFRHVAGLLSSVCTNAQLAEFNSADIRRLTVAWHHEVVGQRADVTSDAEALADTIIQNDRIKRLATNPLLLTTLLLVKRWVGQLPTRRTVLYGKAVEVLLMTWNVEGHDPLDQDEALPQLCYVAISMMRRGIQKISRPDLTNVLLEARQQLSVELGFARIGVSEFIERIEHRSSLLMMTGHDVVDGSLVEFYEFRHLTFQEYLTAKAVVEGWYPNRTEVDSVASVLASHFRDEKWREVIPLAAVLAGRRAEALMERLLLESTKHSYLILATCLADEVLATPEMIRRGLRVLLSNPPQLFQAASAIASLLQGRYRTLFREEIADQFFANPSEEVARLFAELVVREILQISNDSDVIVQGIQDRLNSKDANVRCEGALAIWRINIAEGIGGAAREFCNGLSSLLALSEAEQLAGCLALSRPELWSWAAAISEVKDIFICVLKTWVESANWRIRRASAFVFARFPPLRRDVNLILKDEWLAGIEEYLHAALHRDDEARAAAVVVVYYIRIPLNDSALLELLEKFTKESAPWRRKILVFYKLLSADIK